MCLYIGFLRTFSYCFLVLYDDGNDRKKAETHTDDRKGGLARPGHQYEYLHEINLNLLWNQLNLR